MGGRRRVSYPTLKILCNRDSSAGGSRNSQVQISTTRQPRASSSSRFAASRALLRACLSAQKSVRVFGSRAYLHMWPCQKQPCTKTTVRHLASTMSGVPGSVETWTRKRSPRRCSIDRTVTSGAVCFRLTEAMIRLRAVFETVSIVRRGMMLPAANA